MKRDAAAGGMWRRLGEPALWVAVPLVVAGGFADYYVLAGQVAATALFALSLNLLVGYAGLLSLGHAVFFGVGAYTAGLLAVAGWGEPLTGLLAGVGAAALFGLVCSGMVLRVRHLAQLMVTLGIGLMVYEAANRWRALTGGDDGLHGMVVWPLLGLFEFDFWGRTGFFYAYAVLALGFVLFTCIVRSPFGLALQGLRENPQRMAAMGTPVHALLRRAYVMAAALAGAGGAVLAQTTQFVSLETLSFHLSAEALIMVVLGGAGYRYGGLLGAAALVIARDVLAAISPAFWQFGLGAAMVLVVWYAADGIVGGGVSLRRILTGVRRKAE